jgi:hypothetical protein
MRKKRLGKDEKREVTPEFVNMSKEILYPQIQGVTSARVASGRMFVYLLPPRRVTGDKNARLRPRARPTHG